MLQSVTGIIWTNRMTEIGVEKYLSHKDYVIQIWTTGKVSFDSFIAGGHFALLLYHSNRFKIPRPKSAS